MGRISKIKVREFFYGAGTKGFEKGRMLRKQMTQSEQILWQQLRRKQFLGLTIRRQHPISRFIVDFYCHQARLVIELDGSIHDSKENQEYDANRTDELEMLGLKVIRFRNEEIINSLNYVLGILEETIKSRIPTL